jgi:TonB family protein
MKTLLTGVFLFLSTLFAHGESAYNPGRDTSFTIKYDTINIRGIIYRYDGKPVTNIRIGLFHNNFHPPGFPTSTTTDANGNFELKGASPNGKLQLIDGRYIHVLFPIKGSRFLVIYLPPALVKPIINDTILFTAVRKQARIIPAFKIHDTGQRIFDGEADVIYPRPTMGNQIQKFIKDNLVYPQTAVEHNIEGLVEIGFIVAKDGTLTDIRVLKGIGYGCEEQLIKTILKAGKWVPGICAGDYFTIQQSIAVSFKLTDK